MENRQLIGKLTLQENVSPLERNKIPNTFVVNIPNPLASYYGRFTSIEKPHSILFITKDPVSFEKILRATKKINEENAPAGIEAELTFTKVRIKRERIQEKLESTEYKRRKCPRRDLNPSLRIENPK